ncbi:response regulator [Candidatus Thiothrix sp. Deng01]|uniref:Response regulator n=1 Tax=Candidatus Thiothrix phosphatis TaxID=3112415 RepID=A0ABU6CXN5_9GAMM|nr:response regulator [Candidatus Thiothrix sp. Deng01]MEB4591586.1 response regulator [Candidatus Thiothrix sp. Deng01]
MKKTVYIVDDDDAVRASIQFLLEAGDFTVSTYESALAFEAAFEGGLDLAEAGCVLADLRMPGITGIELVQRLRRREQDIPVIIMSGHGGQSARNEAKEAGVFDFLEKPFDADALFGIIDRAIASREATHTGLAHE